MERCEAPDLRDDLGFDWDMAVGVAVGGSFGGDAAHDQRFRRTMQRWPAAAWRREDVGVGALKLFVVG